MSDVLVSTPVSHIVTFWRVGSHDHSWADEYAELMDPDNEATQAILKRVDSDGIDFHDDIAPVMLGSDGRVWDGHHRICIAIQRGTPYLMCDVVRPDERIKQMAHDPDYFAKAQARHRKEVAAERAHR